MQRTKWIERKFTFDFPEGWMFNILERLRGTPIRIFWITANLHDDLLSKKSNGKWSIKEEIGHLSDLEALHEGRIDDFLQRKETLRAADMSNTLTHGSNHNEKSIEDLLKDFTNNRTRLVERLSDLDDETLYLKSMHPRLQIMMRPVDMAYFTAEHDDHHLATIRNLINAG